MRTLTTLLAVTLATALAACAAPTGEDEVEQGDSALGSPNAESHARDKWLGEFSGEHGEKLIVTDYPKDDQKGFKVMFTLPARGSNAEDTSQWYGWLDGDSASLMTAARPLSNMNLRQVGSAARKTLKVEWTYDRPGGRTEGTATFTRTAE